MGPFRLDRLTPVITLLAFLFFWWLTPSFLKLFVQASFQEFQAPVWVITDSLDSVAHNLALKRHSKKELINVIAESKRQNAYYRQIKELNKTYKDEIERLESILGLPSRDVFRHEIAQVIQRNMGSWWQVIRINKGRKHGLGVGDAVIFVGGVVGRVSKTNYYTSEVDLLSSNNFRISAAFIEDRRPLVYQGAGTDFQGKPIGTIKNAPQDLITDSTEPLQLLTTGLGGAFPPGIKIGFVPWLESDNTGLFQAGQVSLDKRLLGIKEVAVLVPYNRTEELQDAF